MKKFFLLSVLLAAVGLSACKLSETAYYDDVYTVSSDAQYAPVKNTAAVATTPAPAENYIEYERNTSSYDGGNSSDDLYYGDDSYSNEEPVRTTS